MVAAVAARPADPLRRQCLPRAVPPRGGPVSGPGKTTTPYPARKIKCTGETYLIKVVDCGGGAAAGGGGVRDWRLERMVVAVATVVEDGGNGGGGQW
ncbi:hypothetical protein L1987_20363 [Smallanthus sonchifolius]|uniref:Uncharacterized protein n=1 Tax=Smallanthus sonchifolius TaxID=185202 RepID=A0ACB9ISE2_9ASTR|nr:hypothetical protein L1987_20363 [Smallanthus sonchifolius]